MNIKIEKRTIKTRNGRVPLLLLLPETPAQEAPGILWIHGGGYFLGMKEMVFMSRAMDLVQKYGAVVVSPGYRMAFQKPYPAAIKDCYAALLYLYRHAEELGVNRSQIMVGGESAGGGLCAALCMLARDRGQVPVAYQMPIYPMIDNFDTETSAHNHGKVWNTRRNHLGWRLYLRKSCKKKVSPYASAARQKDYRNLPPAYTFVGDGEPFYKETLDYIDHLKAAGVEASVDVYHTDMHAFDMIKPQAGISRQAAERFNEKFEYAMKHYFV